MKKVLFGALAFAAAAVTLSACGSGEKTEGTDTVQELVNDAVKGPVTPETPADEVVYNVDVESSEVTTAPDGQQEVQNEVQMTPEGAQ
ncbi:MAG: hypothetical protein K2K84_07440 [Muribaculaceae bacterium]|nr:hypothetical protein [Muribaculaceae bacterium]